MAVKKRALVTGATGGIGQAIVRRLAEQYHVIIHTHSNTSKAEKLLAEIEAAKGSAEICQFDVSDPIKSAQVLQALIEKSPIQILVNNAGKNEDVPLAGMQPEQWHQVIDVNLNSFYYVTQPLILPMMSTRWGRIINISSVAGLVGNRGQVNYSAAKAGVHGASRSLAVELASRNITVNVIAPGIIDTGMTENKFSVERIKSMVPMNRAGRPEEVAALVSFLASDDAAYISGQVISINGAMM